MLGCFKFRFVSEWDKKGMLRIEQDLHVSVLWIRAEMCFVTYVVSPSAPGGERSKYLTWKEWKAAGKLHWKESNVSDYLFIYLFPPQGSILFQTLNCWGVEGSGGGKYKFLWGNSDTVHGFSAVDPWSSQNHRGVLFYSLNNVGLI